MAYTNVKLDKLVLSNLKVTSFGSDENYRALIAGQFIEVNKGVKNYCYASSNKEQIFSSFKINDSSAPFDRLVMSRNAYGEFSEISLSIEDEDTGNLYCYSVDEYKDRIKVVEDYLEKHFQVKVDCTELEVKSIEINKTISLENEFHKYERVYAIIQNDLPKRYRAYSEYKDGKHIETGVSAGTFRKANSKECEIVKIYDKTKQLMRQGFKGDFLDERYLRIEFTLKGKRVVDKYLQTYKFHNLSQENIDRFFESRIGELLGNIEKHQKININEIDKMMGSYKGEHGWIKRLLSELIHMETKRKYPMVLDVSQLAELIDNKFSDIKRQHKYRIKQKFQNYVHEFPNAYDLLGQRDDKKLKEIISKFKE